MTHPFTYKFVHVFKSMIYFGKRAAFTDTLVVLRRITANHFRLFHLHTKMYTLGIKEQIIFPEIDIDKIVKVMGMEITFVTTANTDQEAYALLREFGLPFKNTKK